MKTEIKIEMEISRFPAPTKPDPLRRFPVILLLVLLVLGCGSALAVDIPLTIDLPKAGLTTVVIDDANGNRVRNLIAETLLPAGKTTLTWDGYDEGIRSQGSDDVWMRDLTRRRVAPGFTLSARWCMTTSLCATSLA